MPTTPTGYENAVKIDLPQQPISIKPGQPGYEDVSKCINAIHVLNAAMGDGFKTLMSGAQFTAWLGKFS